MFLTAFALRGYGLSSQPPLEDEAAAAFSAENYMANGMWSTVMWEHPPLRNIVIFLSGRLFGGYSAWGLRFGSVFLGSLTVPALGYLAHGLFRSRAAAYLSAAFLCLDPLHIALSRQAFQESTTAFFIVAGALASLHAVRKDTVALCYLGGVLFSLASASKWHGLFPWAVSAAAYVAAPRLIKGYEGERKLSSRALTATAAYAVVPLAVYTATFIPWLFRGHSLLEFLELQVRLFKGNYLHQASAYAETMLARHASLWFLVPLAWVDFVFHQGKAYLNIAMGNYLTWAPTLPALYYAVRQWMRSRQFETGFAISLFLASYLPLVLTAGRGIWVFSATAVIPFAFLLSAFSSVRLVESGAISRKAVFLYLAAVLVVSALMYPMSTMRALEHSYLRPVTELYNPHPGEAR